MESLVRSIGGEFVLPAPGGDVIRDGAGVLPTGRNIHALDPYRIPSTVAMERGRTAARLIIEAHRKKGENVCCMFCVYVCHVGPYVPAPISSTPCSLLSLYSSVLSICYIR